jgi:hypothetical protein
VEEGNPFVQWAKVLFRMVLLLLPEYLVVVLSLGAAQALVFPHLGTSLSDPRLRHLARAVVGGVVLYKGKEAL